MYEEEVTMYATNLGESLGSSLLQFLNCEMGVMKRVPSQIAVRICRAITTKQG